MPDKRNLKLAVVLSIFIASLLAGCSDPESGTKPFVPPSAVQVKQNQEAQIKRIQDNPNIPADQKARFIAMYQGGGRTVNPTASSAAGSK